MRAAILGQDGQTVVNVIEVADETMATSLGAVAVSDAVQISWQLVGENWRAPQPPPPTKEELYAHAAATRWRKETSGVLVGDLAIPTDQRTQAVLTAAVLRAQADEDYTIPAWKVGPDTYVSLDAETIEMIGDAVAAHVEACFVLNQTVDAGIAAGTITTVAAINAAFGF